MTIKLNTNLVPLFSGTYDTFWEVRECADNGDELEVDYKHEDLMQSIAEAYQANAAYILSELGCPFIEKLSFDGTFESPSEYNFRTDVLDFTIEVDEVELLQKLVDLKDNADFAEFLKQHYTSYDGFMSFTPNNHADIEAAIVDKNNDFERSVGALISFLAKHEIAECGGGCTIEEMVHEDWEGNGYGGLDYEIVKD